MANVGEGSIDQIRRVYTGFAFLTFNCVIAFVVINLFLGIAYFAFDRFKTLAVADSRVSDYRNRFADLAAYTRTSAADVNALLDEQDAMGAAGLRYAPWVQFRNPTVKGRFLNTDERGFRVTRQPQARPGNPWRVDVFGGSTAFGYGVTDHDTIPSYLQSVLETNHPTISIRVRNFGQAFYYSSQAQLLLLMLAKDGDTPDWAVFIDGGNDTAQLALGHDEPIYTPALIDMWNQRSNGGSAPFANSVGSKLPVVRFTRAVLKRLTRGRIDTSTPANTPQHRLILSDAAMSEAERRKAIDYVLARYQANIRVRRAMCREFGIRCLFVWQPHPSYRYDRKNHKTFPFEGPVPEYFKQVYARMDNFEAADFLNLADLTETHREKAYVDDVHYNEAMNEAIAARIAKMAAPEPRLVSSRLSLHR